MSAYAIVASTPGQELPPPGKAGSEKPKYVYRTFHKLTEKSAEHEKEGWELCSTTVDATGAIVGTFRRPYVKLDSGGGVLKSLQGVWELKRLYELGAEKALSSSSATLKFHLNEFTFTQIDKSGPDPKEYVQKGTVQYISPPDKTKGDFAADLLIENETPNGKANPTNPYATVRTLISLRENGQLAVVSSGLTDDRPTAVDNEAKQKQPAYSEYERKTN
jgi:hypothetical protein